MLLSDFEDLTAHAAWLGRCTRTVLRWCGEPDGLPYTTAGRTRLFNRAWTAEWIASRRTQTNPAPKRRRAA